jgi:hypothetical protein
VFDKDSDHALYSDRFWAVAAGKHSVVAVFSDDPMPKSSHARSLQAE